MGSSKQTIQTFCREILETGSLETKLQPPVQEDGSALLDEPASDAIYMDRPVRDSTIQMGGGTDQLPEVRTFGDPAARAICLSRFANHELQAVELFAWAILAWPEMPSGLRRILLKNLVDEQRHCRLYRDRLMELGTDLGEEPLSDYFWRHVPAIHGSGNGLMAFLSVLGLTLEQANLDYALYYRDAFTRAGDEESARACQIVHDDEIGHVHAAYLWLNRLKDPSQTDVEAYASVVPFPFSAARAKGKNFSVTSRRKAGLSEEMIQYVREARPYQKTFRSLQEGAILYPNLGGEEGAAWKKMRFHPELRQAVHLWRLLFGLKGYVVDDPSVAALNWPAEMGAPPESPVFSWLPNDGSVVPWLVTGEAEAYSRERSLPMHSVSSEVVSKVHDKGFALEEASRQGLHPERLGDLFWNIPAESFLDGGALHKAIQERVSTWPSWARENFTLKPRRGSSGRGRISGKAGKLLDQQIPRDFSRFHQAGGGILEPWLDRELDLSVQYRIDPEGEVLHLATWRAQVSPSGRVTGFSGIVSSDGTVRSGTAWDEDLEGAAIQIAEAAKHEGYWGPCSVDALVFRSPATGESVLRPVVEFNARYTMGTVAAGLVELMRQSEEAFAEQDFLFELEFSASVARQAEMAGKGHFVFLGTSPGQAGPSLVISKPDT